MFACPSGQCINLSWRCDFDVDCSDGADEKNCTYPECSDEEFRYFKCLIFYERSALFTIKITQKAFFGFG